MTEILACVGGLGFRPEVVAADGRIRPPARTASPQEAPEPIGTALAQARAEGRLLLIDFHADWCAPCRVLEAEVLVDPRVREAMAGFRFLRIDTDKHAKPPRAYGVVGLPTLLVLDGDGTEVYRHEGTIAPARLAGELEALQAP